MPSLWKIATALVWRGTFPVFDSGQLGRVFRGCCLFIGCFWFVYGIGSDDRVVSIVFVWHELCGHTQAQTTVSWRRTVYLERRLCNSCFGNRSLCLAYAAGERAVDLDDCDFCRGRLYLVLGRKAAKLDHFLVHRYRCFEPPILFSFD